MDLSVRPGENFYRYANGTWIDNAVIPPDKSSLDTFVELEELSTQRTRAILEEAARTPGSKIGDLYASFLDRGTADARAAEPLRPLFDRIDSASSRGELASVAAALTRMAAAVPFDAWVEADDKAPDVAAVYIAQNGLGMPGRDYYLDPDAALDPKRAAYRDYLGKLLALTGASDPAARAEAVYRFEKSIAAAHWPQEDSLSADKTYNKLSAARLKALAPAFDWDSYLGGLGLGTVRDFIVKQPSAVKGEAELFAAAPLPLLKDYLKVRLLDAYSPYLSAPFVDANFQFYGAAMGGQRVNRDEWKRAVDLVSELIGEEVGKVYVSRYFPPGAKAEADRLVRNVLAAWDRHIQALAWMSPATKLKARAKLAAMVPEIGYPVRWRDYSALEIRRDDLAGNVIRGNQFEYDRLLAKLGRPIDKREWYTQLPPMGVNGYANHKSNQIVFSAAILQPPFFDPYADPAINYGGIGAVIAHEIGHHFDDQGSKYDQSGVLRTWWNEQDVRRFDAATRALVDQYDAYEVIAGKHVNGRFTLGDNIGDLAGVTIAYDAYRQALGGRPAPVLDGFSGDQRFFLGWAQIWRGVFRDEMRLQRLMIDQHAPSEQRVFTVRNEDAWYDAFGVKPGDALYLAPDKRVRLW
jgi:putative endopeptidase